MTEPGVGDHSPTVAELREFVTSGHIYGGVAPEDDRWRVVGEPVVGDRDWGDLRSYQARIFHEQSPDPDKTSAFRTLLDDLDAVLHTRLRRSPIEWMLPEIAGDLYLMVRGAVFEIQVPLFNEMFEVYRAGGFPCGWDGHYPDGRLVAPFPAKEG